MRGKGKLRLRVQVMTLAGRPIVAGVRRETPEHVLLSLREHMAEVARPSILEDAVRVMADAELDQGGQDRQDILPLRRDPVANVPRILGADHPFEDAFPLQVPEPHTEHPWREARVVPQNFAEGVQLEEADIPEEQEGPLSSEATETRSDRADLEGDLRKDGFLVRVGRGSAHGITAILLLPTWLIYYTKYITSPNGAKWT